MEQSNHGKKITVLNPLVEMDGDEMAHVMWQLTKTQLVLPFLDISLISFDLSIANREDTNDEVTQEAIRAVQKYKVGIKCATISPDEARVTEFGLKKKLRSPNATLRRVFQGTIFREPIIIKNIPRLVKGWEKPIIVCRQAFGDQYDGVDFKVEPGTTVSFSFQNENGKSTSEPINQFSNSGGAIIGAFNSRENIEQFAVACFEMALKLQLPLYLSTKNTIMKDYDGFIHDVFRQIYQERYKAVFLENNLIYEHRLIDDMAAFLIKSQGGYVWACKNADGDVFSALVSQGFGSPALMTSELIAPNGVYFSDHAHGTITRHYRDHQRGLETSTNPVAIIFAWSRGLKRRAELDENQELLNFAKKLEELTIETIESGTMTKDLASLAQEDGKVSRDKYVNTQEFISHIQKRLQTIFGTH